MVEDVHEILGQTIEKELPRKELEKYIVDFLGSHSICTLATSKNDKPRATTVEYHNKGMDLFMVGQMGVKIENIRANPNVSVALCMAPNSWLNVKGMQITGKAKILTPSDPDYESALTVYNWQILSDELGFDVKEHPKYLRIIKIEPEKIEILDVSFRANGYSPRQILTLR